MANCFFSSIVGMYIGPAYMLCVRACSEYEHKLLKQRRRARTKIVDRRLAMFKPLTWQELSYSLLYGSSSES